MSDNKSENVSKTSRYLVLDLHEIAQLKELLSEDPIYYRDETGSGVKTPERKLDDIRVILERKLRNMPLYHEKMCQNVWQFVDTNDLSKYNPTSSCNLSQADMNTLP